MVVPCVEHRGRVGDPGARYAMLLGDETHRGTQGTGGGIARINFTWWEDDRLLGERAREGARQRDMGPRR